MARSKSVHRPLSLHSPRLKGADVSALQSSVNEQLEHLRIDREIEVDGVLGGETFDAAEEVANCLGVCGEAQQKLKQGVVSEGTQKLVRGRDRSDAEREAGSRRKDYREKLRKRYAKSAGEEAIAKSAHLVGLTESPPGSNKGPVITDMQVFTGYAWVAGAGEGVYWCGCCACWIVVKIGGAAIPDRQRLGFAPYITADALAHANGLRAVPVEKAQAGDIGCLWGGEHIVTVRGPARGGMVPTREGNTSAPGSSGSQSNGGGVFDRERPVGDFDRGIVARPDWG